MNSKVAWSIPAILLSIAAHAEPFSPKIAAPVGTEIFCRAMQVDVNPSRSYACDQDDPRGRENRVDYVDMVEAGWKITKVKPAPANFDTATAYDAVFIKIK